MRQPPRELVLARLVPDAAELGSASAWLEERRAALEARGVVARAASFTRQRRARSWPGSRPSWTSSCSWPTRPTGFRRGAPDDSHAVLDEAPCDVALLAPRDAAPAGPVLVPFGGAEHDWAAVELGAWLARALQAPLRLAGAAAVPEQGKRDASRLLSHGALAVQRVLGISAEPVLTAPGEEGMLEASRDAGLVVVGSVDEMASRGPRPGPAPARPRGDPADAARPAGSSPGRPRSAARAHALHLVDPALVRNRSSCASHTGLP